jgi:sialidase-1
MSKLMPSSSIPLAYYTFAHAELATALLALVIDPAMAAVSFHHPRTIALVHLLTLAWLSGSILGSFYIVAPLALRLPMPAGTSDWVAFGSFVLGTIGMVYLFWINAYQGIAWPAGLVAGAFLWVAWRAWRGLPASGAPWPVALHVALAFFNILAAALLGILIGLNRTRGFLEISPLAAMFAHLHLAAVGWPVMMVIGFSYRLMAKPAMSAHGCAFVLQGTCMKHVSTTVVILLLSVIVDSTSARAQPGSLRETEVYVAGEGGYHTYRIPAMIVTAKGTVLAFAEGRQAGATDSGNIDLVLKRSHDGGASWSALQVLVDNGPNSASNPCPVIDRKTGTIWLLSTRNLGTDRESDIIAGKSKGTPTVWAMKSEDDGLTWSPPVEITTSVKDKSWTWYATGPGIGIQTKDGRLVIPANHAEYPGGDHRSHLFFSDNGGATWTLGGSADPGTNESQVVELTDGRLMLNMRNHPPKPVNFRMVATSRDGGRTLSSARPDPALIEAPAQASILRYPAPGPTGRNLILFSNAASSMRERLTVRASYDDGSTWAAARVVHDGPAAYSILTVLPDGLVGLLFERGDKSPYEKLTFASFPLAWLTDGKPAGSPR